MNKTLIILILVFVTFLSAKPKEIKIPSRNKSYSNLLSINPKYHPPIDTSISSNFSEPAYLNLNSKYIKTIFNLDYEGRKAEIIRYYEDDFSNSIIIHKGKRIRGIRLWSHSYSEFNEYLEYLKWSNYESLLIAENPFFSMYNSKKTSLSNLEIHIPLKLPSWAMRVVGNEGVNVKISGSIKGFVDYTRSKRTGEIAYQDDANTNSFKIDQQTQLNVKGSIGKLINVQIQTNTTDGFSQSGFDDLKEQLKIHYKGKGDELEDDILQEIEAGYTSFNLSGASFDGYSVGDGFFGVKSKLKFGDLDVTLLAATEETKSVTKNIGLGSGEAKYVNYSVIDEMSKDRVFFLDSIYKNRFYDDFTKLDPALKIADIKVMKYLPGAQSSGALDCQSKINGLYYREMIDGDEYFCKKEDGYIIFNNSLWEDDEIIVGFATSNISKRNSLKSMDSVVIDEYSCLGIGYKFFLLRPRRYNVSKDSSLWELNCKNIYSLPVDSATDISLIYSSDPSSAGNSKIDGHKTYLNYFGFHDSLSGILWDKDKYSDFYKRGLFVFNNPLPFLDTLLPDSQVEMYSLASSYLKKTEESKFFFRIKTTKVGSIIMLDAMGIIENSLRVRLGGRELVDGVDYLFDSMIGRVELLSHEAKTNADKLEISYEYLPMLASERKTFFGAQARYNLDDLGKGSYLALSLLNRNETSGSGKKVQLGHEPVSNVLLDLNGKLQFEPTWMTKAMNFLPLINTRDKSTLSISAEVAVSTAQTNTRFEAFVDDFESSDEPYPLDLKYFKWYWASQPDTSHHNNGASDEKRLYFSSLQCWGGNQRPERVGYFAWYNNRISRKDIWSSLKNEIATSTEEILVLKLKPYKGSNGMSTVDSSIVNKSWGGILLPVENYAKEMLQKKYIEFWAKGTSGKLHIDLGLISEDLRIATGTNGYRITNADPDGKLFQEQGIVGAQLEPPSVANDLGLDLVTDSLEGFLYPLEIVGNKIRMDVLTTKSVLDGKQYSDPAGDNFIIRSTDGSTVYSSYNGTESNSTTGKTTDSDIKKLYDGDSEDLFDPRGLQNSNSYFHFTIDLSNGINDFYCVSKDVALSGWKQYRIPLKNIGLEAPIESFLNVNNADLIYANAMRIWIDGFKQTDSIQIAAMNMVGNKWTEMLEKGSTDKTKISTDVKVSVVNNIEDLDYERPDYTNSYRSTTSSRTVEKEQSLSFSYKDLNSLDTFYVEKKTDGTLDLTIYKKIRFYFKSKHNYQKDNQNLSNYKNITAFLRFGSSKDAYYEIQFEPHQDWDSVTVYLNDLSTLKQIAIDSSSLDLQNFRIEDSLKGICVKGKPTYASVTYMQIGVYVNNDISIDYSDTLWINDLKVIEAPEMKGEAAMASIAMNFANIMGVDSKINYTSGEFLKLNERKTSASASANMGASFNTSFKLDKFLPAKYGINIPVTLNLQGNVNHPLRRNNSDYFLSSDAASDLAPDLFALMVGNKYNGTSLSSNYTTRNYTRTLGTSFSKSSKSKNLISNLFLDRMKTNYSYNYSENLSDASFDKNISYKNNLDYNGKFDNSKFTLRPFKNINIKFLKNNFGDLSLSVLPNNLRLKIYDFNFSESNKDDRNLNSVNLPPTYKFNLSHSYSYSYPLLDWKFLDVGIRNISKSISRNLDKKITQTKENGKSLDFDFIGENALSFENNWSMTSNKYLGDFGRSYILAGEVNRKQDYKYYFEPKLFSFLKHSLDYSSSYSHNLNIYQESLKDSISNPDTVIVINKETPKLDITSRQDLSLDANLNLVKLLDKINTVLPFDGSKFVVKKFKKSIKYFGIKPVRFDYSLSVDRGITNLDSIPLDPLDYASFKMGFYKKDFSSMFLGEEDKTQFASSEYTNPLMFTPKGRGSNDSRIVKQEWGSGLDFKLPFLFNVNLGTKLNYSRIYTEKVTNQSVNNVDTTISWPNYSIRGTISDLKPILQLLPWDVFNKISMNLSSNYSYGKTMEQKFNLLSGAKERSIEDISRVFSPLLKTSVSYKKLTASYDFDYRTGINKTSTITSESFMQDLAYEHRISFSYTIKKMKEIKILFFKPILFEKPIKLNGSYSYKIDHLYSIGNYNVNLNYNDYLDFLDDKNINEDSFIHKLNNTHKYNLGTSYQVSRALQFNINLNYEYSISNDNAPILEDENFQEDGDEKTNSDMGFETSLTFTF